MAHSLRARMLVQSSKLDRGIDAAGQGSRLVCIIYLGTPGIAKITPPATEIRFLRRTESANDQCIEAAPIEQHVQRNFDLNPSATAGQHRLVENPEAGMGIKADVASRRPQGHGMAPLGEK